MKNRYQKQPNPFEEGFFENVRARYLALARSHPQRVHLIDAGMPVDQVSAQIQQQVAGFLAEVDQ